ncbi:hypothetical protein ABNB59_21180 [Paenibacillus larvae]|uniref:ABC transporter substrate-binding protein n=3 Tax=Paenibacillus larvae TaxID=1464 RepID=V9W8F2_9BACL|nr:hypothetical protein [Paenibacillus larvae]AHD06199.1 hypothetical protein ERIC2_c24080 [Paenibacillus larvae subsp. larvae DSM 25430]AQR77286.1 hypothetical protein BXP28_07865 [Paenibacillus larvae subsp. larvae]AVF21730.1 hypothetical protein ERICI_01864 [Paenibacillus larvae subsp. larvae]AVG12736.1 hypothetical protein ERICII_02369 [Paenibacillus larvae subsp. larvae DSM 25430]ETK27576.1 hypothetical protein ERIC1_1c10220 [Paenibacillus larvae subsp. larvae DSM 25719]
MKKFLSMVMIISLMGVLAACGDKSTEASKKEPAATGAPSKDKKDIWTYYENAKWTDDFKGLKTEIEKVVVSDKAPQKDDPSKMDASAVGIKINLHNTTDGKFTTYPDQARLVTSTGEQIETPFLVARTT